MTAFRVSTGASHWLPRKTASLAAEGRDNLSPQSAPYFSIMSPHFRCHRIHVTVFTLTLPSSRKLSSTVN